MDKRSYMVSAIFIGLCFLLLFAFNVRILPVGIKESAEEIKERSVKEDLSLFDKAQIVFVTLNRESQEAFCFRQQFIEFNGLMGKALGKNQVNEIVKLKNGYLSSLMEQTEVDIQAQRTIDFADALEEEGIRFLYVQAPYLIAPGNEELPRGIEDYSNADADAYLELIQKQGVETLDIRKSFMSSQEGYYSYFFRTDHHWNSEGAFEAYQTLAEYLEDFMDIQFPEQYIDRTQYKETVYKDYFLGANGKRTGLYYNGVDDISILYPSFDTNITVRIPSENIFRMGEFGESVLDWSHVKKKDYYGKNCYHTYIGGEYPLVEMENSEAPIDKKIMLIKDSFALPVQAFLSVDFKEIKALDLRLYGKKTAYDFAMEYKPDIVIVLYNPYMLLNKDLYLFDKNEKK